MTTLRTTLTLAALSALTLLLAPNVALTDASGRLARRLHNDEDGASELVTIVLVAAGLAAAALAVVVIIRTFVTNEATNIPGTGG